MSQPIHRPSDKKSGKSVDLGPFQSDSSNISITPKSFPVDMPPNPHGAPFSNPAKNNDPNRATRGGPTRPPNFK